MVGIQTLANLHFTPLQSFSAVLLGYAASAIAFELLGRRAGWTSLRLATGLQCLFICFAVLSAVVLSEIPLAEYRWRGVPPALAACWWLLRRHDSENITIGANAQALVLTYLTVLVPPFEVAARLSGQAQGWRLGAVGVVLVGSLIVLAQYIRKHPVATTRVHAIRLGAFLPAFVGSLLWCGVVSLTSAASVTPLPYVPLLNPLEAAQILLLITCWYQRGQLGGSAESRRYVEVAVMALGFVLLNALILRTVHHYEHIPYVFHELWSSVNAQAALSVCWTATALVGMVIGGEVSAWLTGDITQDRAPEIRQPTTPLPMQDLSINSSNNTPTNAGFVLCFGQQHPYQCRMTPPIGPTTPLPMQAAAPPSPNNTPTNAGSSLSSPNNTPTNAGETLVLIQQHPYQCRMDYIDLPTTPLPMQASTLHSTNNTPTNAGSVVLQNQQHPYQCRFLVGTYQQHPYQCRLAE